MAWFNFGKNDSGMHAKAAVQKPLETVEAMRQRAKFRLIGAAVLVLAGVVGFPLLFDSQPRPVSIDIPIDIPDKAKVRPLGAPAVPATAAPAAKVDAGASLSGKEEIVAPAKSEAKIEENKPAAQSNGAQAATKSIASGAAIAAATVGAAATAAALEKAGADKARKAADEEKAKKLKADKTQAAEKAKAAAEASRAKGLLDGAAASTEAGRFIVQFGAFSDAAKAREVRQKVEKAGLKTYSQVAKTTDGERIRVRVGPFATRAEADKAAAKIKSLDLPASVLTL